MLPADPNGTSPGPQPIRVIGESSPSHYQIAVQDHGPGISPTLLPHVFEPGIRGTPPAGSPDNGAGLGLTIAFIHDLAPHPRQVWLLAVGWTLWCASLLLVLLSYLSSMAAHAQIIDQMDERVPSVRRPRQWTTWFNYTAALLLVAGVGFVVGFAWYFVQSARNRRAGVETELMYQMLPPD